MPTYMWVIGGVLALTVVGFVRVRSDIGALQVIRRRISAFLAALRTYMASEGSDTVAYTDLLSLSALLQDDLGPEAIVSFKPAFSDVSVAGYPALVNHVPALHYELNIATFKDGRRVAVYATGMQEILLRAEARLDVQLTSAARSLRNPIVLLLQGIRALVALPLWFLAWSGAIPNRRAEALASSFVVRLLSAAVLIVGLVGSVITIALGWSPFLALLRWGGGK